MATGATIKMFIAAAQAATSPYAGGGTVQVTPLGGDRRWSSGTGDYQFDAIHQSVQSVNGSANEDVDLSTLTDPNGDTINPAEIAALVIEADAANAGALTFKQAVSNGWSSLFGGTTDGIKCHPGQTIIVLAPLDGTLAVGATNKSYNVANAGASAATYTLTLLARTS